MVKDQDFDPAYSAGYRAALEEAIKWAKEAQANGISFPYLIDGLVDMRDKLDEGKEKA